MNEYEVRVTRQVLEQMKEIVHYISNDLMTPDAADNLLDKMKAEINKLSDFPKKYALIDEEPWRTEEIRNRRSRYVEYFPYVCFFHKYIKLVSNCQDLMQAWTLACYMRKLTFP